MGAYIAVYVVLIAIVVFLLWIGRKVSKNRGATGTKVHNWFGGTGQGAAGQTSPLFNLSGFASRIGIPNVAPQSSSSAEVKQAIEVVEEMYADFEDEITRLRADFSEALKALHSNLDERLRRLELTDGQLELQYGSEPIRDAATMGLATSETAASIANDEPASSHIANLGAVHGEAIQRMQAGEPTDVVARHLGLGIGEAEFLKRLVEPSLGRQEV